MCNCKPNSYVRATIWHVESVEVSDGPGDYHTGPDYDLYEVRVEYGPAKSFLDWFHQSNVFDLCRVGSTSNFVDLGSSKTPANGEVIDLTFDEFFPQWLDTAASVAKAKIAEMARVAISQLA